MMGSFACTVAILLVGAIGYGGEASGDQASLGVDMPDGGRSVNRDIARGQLYTVAVVHAGLVEISFPKDEATGLPSVRYDGNPEVHLSQSERLAILDPIVAKMKIVADTDESGTVSDEEATQFRRLYEFARCFEQAVDSQVGAGAAIAEACGRSASSLRASIVAYNELVLRADAVGLDGFSKITWDGQE